MQVVGEWVLVFILAASVLGIGPAQPTGTSYASESSQAVGGQPSSGRQSPALQSSALHLTGPTGCPPSGCAGKQRIGMRYEFDLSGVTLDDASGANVRVCLYANAFDSAYAPTVSSGEISGSTYNRSTSDCGTGIPTGFTLLTGLEAELAVGTPGDALRFAFRLGTAGTGQVRAHLYARSGGWRQVTTTFSQSLNIDTPVTSNPVYVANDAAACGSQNPCYINSYGDEAEGFGTGLKDAVDAGNTNIFVLGNYTIKANTVKVNRALTLTGSGSAKITYNGANNASLCQAHPMLELNETVILRNLTIDDGNCNSATAASNRNLLWITSPVTGAVRIESSDLTGGNNAIFVSSGNQASVIVRFNQITGNLGQAIYFEGDGDSGLQATANNMHGNSASPPVDCKVNANTRKADHNYWGASAPTNTNCSLNPAKRLGAPIVRNSPLPGVRATEVLVEGNRKDVFSDQIGFRRSGTGGSDFNMYVVDHGYMISSGPPFSGLLGGESPSPCSNYWDVFLADGAAVHADNKLELYVRYYNKQGETPGCLAVINSTQYCDQSDKPEKYPLFWLDPSSSSVTRWWDPVGGRPENLDSGEGQTTACNISANEIRVSIDTSGRPNLNDLNYTPFMVGVPVIKSFKPFASSNNVRVEWITNNEPDIRGFYVLRGTDSTNLTPINGDIIPRSGNASTGFTYNRTDSGRVNGETYYYRLQVERTDGYSFYSAIERIVVNAATPTSPPPTWTATLIRPSSTPVFTTVPPNNPTRIPSSTPIPVQTRTPTATLMILPTLTSTLNILTPGVLETQNALNSTLTASAAGFEGWAGPGTPGFDGTIEPDQAAGTEIAMAGSTTPDLDSTVVAAETIAGARASGRLTPWLSLLLGLLAGLVAVGGAGSWWYFSAKK